MLHTAEGTWISTGEFKVKGSVYLTFFCHGAGQKDHDFEDKKAVLVQFCRVTGHLRKKTAAVSDKPN